VLSAGGEATEPPVAPPPEPVELAFEKLVVDAAASGPAFVEVGDVNGDGRLDMIVAAFGNVSGATLPNGTVTAYLQGEALGAWTKQPILSPADGVVWPNEPTSADLDGDGDLDVIIPAGFLVCEALGNPCGALLWMEQTPTGWQRHDLVPSGDARFYHGAALADVDGDGIDDLITVAERITGDDRAVTRWFRGTVGPARFDLTPRDIGVGLGSLPVVADLDGDGDLDIAGAEFFAELGASYAWFERTADPSADAPAGRWQRHVIDPTSGPAIQLSVVPDLLGDGRVVAVGSNHVNTTKEDPDPWPSTITLHEPSSDPRQPWSKRVISSHITSRPGRAGAPAAAPGIFGWGDADRDGDVDLLVSGDGDDRVFLLEQSARGTFDTHVLEANLGQAGGMKIVDLDGDGVTELIVTSYERDLLSLYRQRDGGPHPIGLAAPVDHAQATLSVPFDVHWSGGETGDLILALFTDWPPAGPPDAFRMISSVQLPMQASLQDVAIGSYTALVALDLPPNNPMVQGPEDPRALVRIDVAADMAPIVVPLALGTSTSAPSGGPADVDVTVDYPGADGGDLVVAAFDRWPPAGPPVAFEIVPMATFPNTVRLAQVRPGATQLLAFLDLAPHNVMSPGPEDPQAVSMPFQVAGSTVAVSLTLAR